MFSHCPLRIHQKMSTAVRPNDRVSVSYFIMLPVMATLHISQKGKKKGKKKDSWKDSILIGLLLDKKKISLYLYDLIFWKLT